MLENVVSASVVVKPARGAAGRSYRQVTVLLRDVQVEAVVGVSNEERQSSQVLLVNIDIVIEESRACFSDRIKDTIDYAAIVTEVRRRAKDAQFSLLESFAEHLCKTVTQVFQVNSIRLEVFKSAIIDGVEFAGVRLERRASDYRK
jgi:dihydroneopterin aldolase